MQSAGLGPLGAAHIAQTALTEIGYHGIGLAGIVRLYAEHDSPPEGEKEELVEPVGEVVVAQAVDDEAVSGHGISGLQ